MVVPEIVLHVIDRVLEEERLDRLQITLNSCVEAVVERNLAVHV